jgi:ribosomal-protein-alanine N-acetyltransferase
VDRIAEVEAACFSVPWTADAFRSLVDRTRVRVLVAELPVAARTDEDAMSPPGVRIVGHGILWWAADEAELANLAVAPGFRGRGIAGALLDQLTRDAWAVGVQAVFLEVRSSNEAAVALYEGRGFHQVGVRRQYYTSPTEDARVLQLRRPPNVS